MGDNVGGKIRESGMPSEEVWSGFFNVEKTLDDMKVNSEVKDAADYACGYGTFTIPAARRIRGIMFALDIDPQMVRGVVEKTSRLGLGTVRPLIRDLLRDGSGLRKGSVDYVILFNILHLEDPLIILHDCLRVLRQGGRVGIIHWIHDPDTPRGPPLEMRPTVEQCIQWCLEAGFATGTDTRVNLKPYHFGLLMRK
jgi:SAM-dependent methyltransferase